MPVNNSKNDHYDTMGDIFPPELKRMINEKSTASNGHYDKMGDIFPPEVKKMLHERTQPPQ